MFRGFFALVSCRHPLATFDTPAPPLDAALAGNHDTFNMPLRGGPNDFFAKHAAEGKRRPSHQQRVYLHQLPVPPAQEQGSGSRSGDGSSGNGCPAAWFLGLDPTPEPGLRSPTNFAGGWALDCTVLSEAAAPAEAGVSLQACAGVLPCCSHTARPPHPPLNGLLAGLARPAFLDEVRAALQSIEQPSGCGPPLIIAYCHYPLR